MTFCLHVYSLYILIYRGEEPILGGEVDSASTTAFIVRAAGVAQKDMELVVDARRLVGSCLQYKMDETIEDDPHVLDVLKDTETFEKVLSTLLRDYDAGTLPKGGEEAFADAWKGYFFPILHKKVHTLILQSMNKLSITKKIHHQLIKLFLIFLSKFIKVI